MNAEPKKRIFKAEFSGILNRIIDLSAKEKAYLMKVFDSYLQDGLTEWELRDQLNKLAFNDNDGVDDFELDGLKHKVLSVLGKSE